MMHDNQIIKHVDGEPADEAGLQHVRVVEARRTCDRHQPHLHKYYYGVMRFC